MVWGKAGSDTLSGAGDTIDSGTISANVSNQSMIHTISSSSTNYNLQFNSDTGSNYAYGASYNGGSKANRASQSKCLGNEGSAVTTTAFHVSYIFSIPSEEKLSISHTVRQETAGAGTAPNRQQTVGKYVSTSAITGIQLTNSDSGSFDTNSNLSVLGSDVTPAAAVPAIDDVQDNSLFIDKVNARRYWFEANPLFTDDFSSDNFTHADSSKTSVSSNKFNWEIELDNSDDTAYQALGLTLDNSSWVMRFKITTDTLSTAGNPGAFGKFVLASSNAGQSGSFDWIGFERYVSSASNTWNLGYGDGTSGNTATDGFTTTPAASSTYYMELIRNGTSLTGKMYTGSDYSTGLVDTTTLTISGTVEGLSYFKFYNRSDNTNTSQTATGTIEDLKVWNGVTTASGGGEWNMQPTKQFDLSTSAGWTTTGSNCSVNTSGQYLEGSSSTNDDRATKALGITLSDTKFVVRQKMELTDVTTGGNGQLYFGYTDKDNSTTVLGNRDAIGITIRTGADFLQSYALNQAWQSSATLTTTPTETTYYLEIIRDSATSHTLNLYSDSNYSVLIETKTNTISSSITGLDHITIGGWDNNASGNITARFSNIEIYNGVNTVN